MHKRAPGLLAAPPTPKHRLAKGGLLGKWGEISLWSLSKRGERMEYEGAKDWERSQTGAGGGGLSGLLWRPDGGSGEEMPGKPKP